MTDTRARIHRIVTDHLCAEPIEIADDATFASLGADSLDGIELAMAFEEEFNIHIADDVITEASTVGEAVAAVEGLLA